MESQFWCSATTNVFAYLVTESAGCGLERHGLIDRGRLIYGLRHGAQFGLIHRFFQGRLSFGVLPCWRMAATRRPALSKAEFALQNVSPSSCDQVAFRLF